MNNPAIALLEEAIVLGSFDPKVDDRTELLKNSKESWYSRALARGEDEEALDARLADMNEASGRTAFAKSIAATARGMLALAQTDPAGDLVKVLPASSWLLFPAAQSLLNGGKMIVAFNPVIPGCGCSQPAGSAVFGRGGTLRLQAIVITFGASYSGHVKISLVFPFPADLSGAARNGFATVTIEPDGSTSGDCVSLSISEDQVLQYGLGMIDTRQLMRATNFGSGINAALAFPGAHDYLAKHIGDLGPYLEAAAEALAGRHVH